MRMAFILGLAMLLLVSWWATVILATCLECIWEQAMLAAFYSAVGVYKQRHPP